jgi:uncharacterized membrane protein YdjX (TVP38/TMEM64 family)
VEFFEGEAGRAGRLTGGDGGGQGGRMDLTERTAAERGRHRRRRVAALGLGALGLVGVAVFAATQPPETWARLKEAAVAGTEWIRGLGAGWFFAAFAVLPAVGFPIAPFGLAAGSLFAPVLGLPAVLALTGLSIAVSLTISYVLARYALRPWVLRLFGYLGYTVPQIPVGKQRLAVCLLRMTPGLPYVCQSFLLGLADVPFRTYLVFSWLITTASVSLMVVFGDALMKKQGKTALIALGGVVLVVVAIRLIRRRLTARAEAGLAATAAAEGRAGDGV